MAPPKTPKKGVKMDTPGGDDSPHKGTSAERVQSELEIFVLEQGLDAVSDLNDIDPDELLEAVQIGQLSLGARKFLRESGALKPVKVAGGGGGSAPSDDSNVAKALHARLTALSANPAELIKKCLGRGLQHQSDWPWLGTQYEDRVAPEYLVGIYTTGERAVTYAQKFIQLHALEDCKPARENLMSAATALDYMLLYDGIDVLCSATGEILARRMYATELTFEACSVKGDWRTKSNWKQMDLYDITRQGAQGRRVAAADKTVRKVLQAEAESSKWLAKAGKADQ